MENQNKKPGLIVRGWRGIVRVWRSNTHALLSSIIFTVLAGFAVVSGGGILAIIGLMLLSISLVSAIGKAIIDVIANKGKNNQPEQGQEQTQTQEKTQAPTQAQGQEQAQKNDTLATVDKINNTVGAILTFAIVALAIVSVIVGGSLPLLIPFVYHAFFRSVNMYDSYKTIKESDERANLIKKPETQQARSWWRALFGGGIKPQEEVEQAKEQSQDKIISHDIRNPNKESSNTLKFNNAIYQTASSVLKQSGASLNTSSTSTITDVNERTQAWFTPQFGANNKNPHDTNNSFAKKTQTGAGRIVGMNRISKLS